MRYVYIPHVSKVALCDYNLSKLEKKKSTIHLAY